MVKTWIENYFFDFNDATIRQLEDFIDTGIAANNSRMAKTLKSIVLKQVRGLECVATDVAGVTVNSPCQSTYLCVLVMGGIGGGTRYQWQGTVEHHPARTQGTPPSH